MNYLEEQLAALPEDLRNPEDVREVRGLKTVAFDAVRFRLASSDACHQPPRDRGAQAPDAAERGGAAGSGRASDRRAPIRCESQGFGRLLRLRKTRNSVITKLLAKKENTAATIFDKLRFRIVTEKPEHVYRYRVAHGEPLPFNYVIPGGHNNLVPLAETLARPEFKGLVEGMQGGERKTNRSIQRTTRSPGAATGRSTSSWTFRFGSTTWLPPVRRALGRTAMVLVVRSSTRDGAPQRGG